HESTRTRSKRPSFERTLRGMPGLSRLTLGLMRGRRVVTVCVAVCLLPAAASAAPGRPASAAATASSGQTTSASRPNPVRSSSVPPAGAQSSQNHILRIADALPKVRAVRAKYRGAYGVAIFEPTSQWKVSYYTPAGKEVAQVIVDDQSSRVLEQWTGP